MHHRDFAGEHLIPGLPASSLRRFLQGEPILLVRDGEIIRRNLRRERLDDAGLAEKARLDGIGSIDDIRWAVLETSGEISFSKRSRS